MAMNAGLKAYLEKKKAGAKPEAGKKPEVKNVKKGKKFLPKKK